MEPVAPETASFQDSSRGAGDPDTFYGGGPAGYTDYPVLAT
ncbi:hypothetical protein [Streptomyces hawaiiensis]